MRNGYGGMEFGNPFIAWDQLPRTSTGANETDWYWFHAKDNVQFEPQGDGSYEMVVYVSL